MFVFIVRKETKKLHFSFSSRLQKELLNIPFLTYLVFKAILISSDVKTFYFVSTQKKRDQNSWMLYFEMYNREICEEREAGDRRNIKFI